ncbi:hypothetical protein SS209_00889 [Salmonella enterica subsp. enterica serovar Senftenberg str. SS209]|nr:hypothetical protein SS209_00889 [Salmonella enterica subsp. enterica serovar Senftenberg str. SS209]
MKELAHA